MGEMPNTQCLMGDSILLLSHLSDPLWRQGSGLPKAWLVFQAILVWIPYVAEGVSDDSYRLPSAVFQLLREEI